MNRVAKVGASAVVFVGMKCAIFEKRSTITKIASKLSDVGRLVIRSMEMSCHDASGGCKGRIVPKGRALRGFAFWHSGHVRT